MSARIITALIIFQILFLSACSKTTGSHTASERQRLARLHSHLSFEFLLNDNMDVAQGEAEEALRLDASGVESNHAMARVQQVLNDKQQVNFYYQQALKADPYAVEVLNDYAHYLCQHGDVAKAFENFDLAGTQLMNPQRMVSYTRAARCSINHQRYEKAQGYLLSALELKPDSQAVLLNLVQVQLNMNQPDQATKYLQQYFDRVEKPTVKAIRLAEKLNYDIE